MTLDFYQEYQEDIAYLMKGLISVIVPEIRRYRPKYYEYSLYILVYQEMLPKLLA
jgi:hypothetical protein